MAITLRHQTPAQFAARFWARVKAAYQSDKPDFERLVWGIWDQVRLGNITNDQVRQSFNEIFGRNLTLAQWNGYVTNTLVPIKDRYLERKNQVEL